MNQGNPIDWMLIGWRKFADFSGRARRKEFWMFQLGCFIVSIIASILGNIIGTGLLANIWALVTLVPSIAVGIRRMHDLNKVGWFILIPIYNLVLFCTEGDRGNNQYGPDPKAGEA